MTRNWRRLGDLNGGSLNPLIKYIYYCIIKIYNYEWVKKEEYLEWAMSITHYLITHKVHNLIFKLKSWLQDTISIQKQNCVFNVQEDVCKRYYPTWKYLVHLMVQMASLTITPIWCLECDLPFIATLLSNMMHPLKSILEINLLSS